MSKLVVTFTLNETGQSMSAELLGMDNEITKIEWYDKKTARIITEAHSHDEIVLLAQTEGYDEGDTIHLKIKEKNGNEFSEGVTELNLSSQVAQDFSVMFEIQLPPTFKEGTLYVEEIECNTSFQEVTLKIEECVCVDWGTVEAFIPKTQFVGWGYPNIKKNCFDYAVYQLNKVGYTLKSKGWYGIKGLNPDVFQIYIEKDILNMKGGVQKEAFIEGVKYLKEAITKKIPVLVGVDNKEGLNNDNADKTTDHFVVIVGMGTDDKGNYFTFYDNGDSINGASLNNKFYCKCNTYKLEGYPDEKNRYSKSLYKVTQIRKSKKQ